ncbi:MAG: hypothetical protein AB1607_13480 [Chloroflexota bacterium]
MKKMYPKLKPTKIKWDRNRIVGCQSTDHTSCKGELWECKRCHKVVCWEEGSVDLIDFCDDCWYDIRVSGKSNEFELAR